MSPTIILRSLSILRKELIGKQVKHNNVHTGPNAMGSIKDVFILRNDDEGIHFGCTIQFRDYHENYSLEYVDENLVD